MSYSDLLRDPRWQRMRLEVMEKAGFRCVECGDEKTTLNVHHTYYRKGRMPWEYDWETLRCLCEPCHMKQHPEKVLLPVRTRDPQYDSAEEAEYAAYLVECDNQIVAHSREYDRVQEILREKVALTDEMRVRFPGRLRRWKNYR